MSFLLDTNAVSELMKPAPEPSVIQWIREHEENCFLSTITIGEIERGITLLPSGKRKRHLEKSFKEMIHEIEGRLLSFDKEVASRWALLSGNAQRKGHRLPVLDSMIEATALHWGLTVVTRNTSDFFEAQLLNPWPH